MEFLEDTKEVVEVFQAHVFNTKVVCNEAELDESPFVAPETGCWGRFIKIFGFETGAEKIVSLDACLGQAIATLVDFEVNPSIMVQTCELVFFDELIGDVWDFDANVFGLGHGSIKVELLKVNGARVCTFSREYTIEEEHEKFHQHCVSTHIARVADAVATNGDPCVVRVLIVWIDCRAHGNSFHGYRGWVQIYGIEDTYIQSTYIQITYIAS
jgi:hypothetical protein